MSSSLLRLSLNKYVKNVLENDSLQNMEVFINVICNISDSDIIYYFNEILMTLIKNDLEKLFVKFFLNFIDKANDIHNRKTVLKYIFEKKTLDVLHSLYIFDSNIKKIITNNYLLDTLKLLTESEHVDDEFIQIIGTRLESISLSYLLTCELNEQTFIKIVDTLVKFDLQKKIYVGTISIEITVKHIRKLKIFMEKIFNAGLKSDEIIFNDENYILWISLLENKEMLDNFAKFKNDFFCVDEIFDLSNTFSNAALFFFKNIDHNRVKFRYSNRYIKFTTSLTFFEFFLDNMHGKICDAYACYINICLILEIIHENNDTLLKKTFEKIQFQDSEVVTIINNIIGTKNFKLLENIINKDKKYRSIAMLQIDTDHSENAYVIRTLLKNQFKIDNIISELFGQNKIHEIEKLLTLTDNEEFKLVFDQINSFLTSIHLSDITLSFSKKMFELKRIFKKYKQ